MNSLGMQAKLQGRPQAQQGMANTGGGGVCCLPVLCLAFFSLQIYFVMPYDFAFMGFLCMQMCVSQCLYVHVFLVLFL